MVDEISNALVISGILYINFNPSLESLEKWLKANRDRVELIQFIDLLPKTNG